MSKKHKGDRNGFVYSTDPSFNFESEDDHATETFEPGQQKLRVFLETKQRGGKAVTVIKGFIGKSEDLEALGKSLKNFCGTGGSVKAGEALVQGDQKEKVLQWLLKYGYKQTKKV
jgi:translation initiation factor 1